MTSFALVTLPLELFSDITASLDSLEIARLWFCGSRSLHRLLKLGIRKFELRSHLHSSWPFLVLEFQSLLRFTLVGDKKEPAFVKKIELMLLPTSVTELCLTDVYMPKVLHSNPGILNRLNYFSLHAIKGERYEFSPEANTFLPVRSILREFRKDLNGVDFPVFELSASLSCRPELLTTVTHLTLSNHERTSQTIDLAQMTNLKSVVTDIRLHPLLCSGLTSIHLLHTLTTDQLKALPYTVTDLMYCPSPPVLAGFREILRLPLISLQLGETGYRLRLSDENILDGELAQQLPRSMTKMGLNQLHIRTDAFPFLPTGLKHLCLGKAGKLLLPPDATAKESTSVKVLPEGLEYFSSSATPQFRLIWPRSMRVIDMQVKLSWVLPEESEANTDSLQGADFVLPPKLEALKAISLWEFKGKTPPPSVLPTYLRSLGVTFRKMPKFQLETWLPSFLDHLTLVVGATANIQSVGTGHFSLPKTLVSLELSGALFSTLDSVLKELEIPSLTKLNFLSPLNRATQLMELRAPELKYLKVCVASTIRWGDLSFLHLRKLRKLAIIPGSNCKADNNWPSEWIKRFPSTLVSFAFPCKMRDPLPTILSEFESVGIEAGPSSYRM
jgi:hypothetical protein